MSAHAYAEAPDEVVVVRREPRGRHELWWYACGCVDAVLVADPTERRSVGHCGEHAPTVTREPGRAPCAVHPWNPWVEKGRCYRVRECPRCGARQEVDSGD